MKHIKWLLSGRYVIRYQWPGSEYATVLGPYRFRRNAEWMFRHMPFGQYGKIVERD